MFVLFICSIDFSFMVLSVIYPFGIRASKTVKSSKCENGQNILSRHVHKCEMVVTFFYDRACASKKCLSGHCWKMRSSSSLCSACFNCPVLMNFSQPFTPSSVSVYLLIYDVKFCIRLHLLGRFCLRVAVEKILHCCLL